MQPPVIVVVGPTGVGKTTLAIQLARQFNGEIVSADSRQVYQYMDIGTAKPTLLERDQVPHHLIDFLPPDRTLTLAQFQELAFQSLPEIAARGKIPFLVGGTGQYIRCVIEGWGIPEVAPHPVIRDTLQAEADQQGPEHLHRRLAAIDPDAAHKIDYRNVRRVIRALEVYEVTGKTITELQSRTPPPYDFLQIGLTRPRDLLYERIDNRIDAMMEAGLQAEIEGLLNRGYGWALPSMSGLGYAQFQPFFENERPLEETVSAIKHDTRRFIRHQYNWFKLTDPQINWFDMQDRTYPQIQSRVAEWLATAGSSRL